jgi:hypothetical protein
MSTSLETLVAAGLLTRRQERALAADGLTTLEAYAALDQRRRQTIPMVGPITRAILDRLIAERLATA